MKHCAPLNSKETNIEQIIIKLIWWINKRKTRETNSRYRRSDKTLGSSNTYTT